MSKSTNSKPLQTLQRGSTGANSYALHRLQPWRHQYHLEPIAAPFRQSGQHRGGIGCALEPPRRVRVHHQAQHR